MLEKIRVSLWDIFTFFLTGFLAVCIVIAFVVIFGPATPKRIFEEVSVLPAGITLVVGPLAFTLLGLIVEPFANYFDQYVLNFALGWISKPKKKHSAEEQLLKEEIRAKYLGSLNGRIDNPYALCKEYVETKQLSTTFMVFLSRYGFYRNCAFLSFSAGFASLILANLIPGLLSFLGCIIAAAVLKRRAEDFYSYQAPAIYRAFLIDKLQWAPKRDA